MRKVLLLCEAYGGGVKTYIDSIIDNEKIFSECEFKILVSSKRLGEEARLNKKYIVDNNLSFGISLIKIIKSLKKIDYIVNKEKIDIIHANSTLSGILIYFYSFFNPQITLMYTPHGYYSFKSMNSIKKFITKIVEKKINSICRKIIHVSNSEEKEAIKSKLVSKKKSIVIFNGVKDPYLNKKNQILENEFKIVNLARVDNQKNPFEFIELARCILENNPKVRFIWAGDGEYLEDARKRVGKYNLEDKIDFIGFINNKDEIFKCSNLYLSTSFYEGLPFSVVEAMSYKLPLVLSNIVGHTDLVENEYNGILFNNSDRIFVSNFINSLINDESKLNILSENSYEKYKSNFSLSKMLEKLEDVYRNI